MNYLGYKTDMEECAMATVLLLLLLDWWCELKSGVINGFHYSNFTFVSDYLKWNCQAALIEFNLGIFWWGKPHLCKACAYILKTFLVWLPIPPFLYTFWYSFIEDII